MAGDFLGCAFRKEPKPQILKDWLGGLDSNQDSQIQNLKSCQLDDLPTFVRDDSGSHEVSEFALSNPEITTEQQKRTAALSRVRDSYDSTYSE